MGTETKLPQLKMKILNLSHLEELQVPAGFQCRHYREGDQEIWNEVIDLSFERKKGQSNFAKEMAGDQHFRPERVVLEELNWPERFEPILKIRRGSERLTPFLEGAGRSSLKLPEAIPDGLQSMVNSPKPRIE